MKSNDQHIALLWAGWLLALLFVVFLATTLLPQSSPQGISFSSQTNLFNQLIQWDAPAYLAIASQGYVNPAHFAFFPLYPVLIRLLSVLFSPVMAALFISWFSLLLALMLLYRLIRLDFSHLVAQRSLIYLLIFPTSFFFISAYTESLFLLVVVASFYFARTSRTALAALITFLAPLTRITGISLIPAFLLLPSRRQSLILTPATLFGFFSLLIYFYLNSGNPWQFITAQEHFQRTGFTYPFKVLLSYIKHFNSDHFFQFRANTIISLEWFVSIGFLLLILLGSRRLPRSYTLYALFAWALPLSTGRTGSMLRYVLILFPCFIFLAILGQNRYFHYFHIFLSILLLSLLLVSFTHGFWLA